MAHSMTHLKAILADALIVVILQITGISTDVNIKIQLAGLAGSMLAVRTLDGKQNVWLWLKVAFSGLVLANYTGLMVCEVWEINLNSFRALSVFFFLGIFSDLILRWVKKFGDTATEIIPTFTRAFFEAVKSYFPKRS